MTHICIGELNIIGSDIVWTSAGILLIGPLGTNLSEILIEIQTFSFKKMHMKMSSAKQRPFCVGLNVSTFHWTFLLMVQLMIDQHYHKTSNINHTLAGNKFMDHSDVVGASPIGAAPTTSSFATWHMASMDRAETTARWEQKHLSFGIWCGLY